MRIYHCLEEGNMFLTDREQIIVTRDDDGDGKGDDEVQVICK